MPYAVSSSRAVSVNLVCLSLFGTVICTTYISVVHVLGSPLRCLSSTSVLLLYRTLHQWNIFCDITPSAFTSTKRRGRCNKIHEQIRSSLHTSTFGNTSIRPNSFWTWRSSVLCWLYDATENLHTRVTRWNSRSDKAISRQTYYYFIFRKFVGHQQILSTHWIC